MRDAARLDTVCLHAFVPLTPFYSRCTLLLSPLGRSSKYFAYIHRSEVHLLESKNVALGVEKAETIKVAYTEKDAINQVEFIKIAGNVELLVVINQAGGVFVRRAHAASAGRRSVCAFDEDACVVHPAFACSHCCLACCVCILSDVRVFVASLRCVCARVRQIFDESGLKLLHTYKHAHAGGTPLTLKELHLRGIASDGKELLYIGSGSGDLLIFIISKAKLALLRMVQDVHIESHQQGGGISALAFSQQHNILISGDDWGNVIFWTGLGDMNISAAAQAAQGKQTVKLVGIGAPVNIFAVGIGAHFNTLAAGFASGHIRLYDIGKKSIVAEIGAHTRSINALEMHASRPLLIAAGEDTFVSGWTIPTPADATIKSVLCESPVLGLLTGARFAGSNQELIATTVYDSRSIALLHTP
jgi:WD40 repeat protein